jgi:hypothetical protein
MCVYPDCKTQPTFNIIGEKRMYCSKHKTKEMIDVVSKTCLNCSKQPSYNIVGENPEYCAEHKTKEMIDSRHKTCLNCSKRPTFNIIGEIAQYCSEHKTDVMVDVNSKSCLNCSKRPTFNLAGKKAQYCSEHKTDVMVDVNNKTCLHCSTIPTFNLAGKKAEYCGEHKTKEMINVKDKHCKTPLCLTLVKNKYSGYCLFCYIHMFPDKTVSRNYKTKEQSVVDFIQFKFPLPWLTDKSLGACSRRRPDLMIDLMTHVLIIEVDENQHVDYDCSCQNKRLMELSQDVAHRPIIFIRFNPDGYTDKKRIPSCWGIDGRGMCVVKKQNDWVKRLSTLEFQVNYWMKNQPAKTIEIVQLFYDNV